MSKLLVIGARKDSLGESVAHQARGRWKEVITAGISGDEDLPLDATSSGQAWGIMSIHKPDDVVCTVGINEQCEVDDRNIYNQMMAHFDVNCAGVINLLGSWVNNRPEPDPQRDLLCRFVAVSSNSARIPRRRSAPYCASKAALSMAIQVAAREFAELAPIQTSIYGYEFGYIDGTPMSQEMPSDGRAPHRIPGSRSLAVYDAADIIISGLQDTALSYYANGNMIRIDGGEL